MGDIQRFHRYFLMVLAGKAHDFQRKLGRRLSPSRLPVGYEGLGDAKRIRKLCLGHADLGS